MLVSDSCLTRVFTDTEANKAAPCDSDNRDKSEGKLSVLLQFCCLIVFFQYSIKLLAHFIHILKCLRNPVWKSHWFLRIMVTFSHYMDASGRCSDCITSYSCLWCTLSLQTQLHRKGLYARKTKVSYQFESWLRCHKTIYIKIGWVYSTLLVMEE